MATQPAPPSEALASSPASEAFIRTLPRHLQKALRVKTASAVSLPPIPGWSSSHPLRPFQQQGVMFLYFVRRGFCLDKTGLGKTPQALALIQLLKSRREPYRALVLTTKSAQRQWISESRKFTSLTTGLLAGPKKDRARQYRARWDIMVGTYPLLLRDLSYIRAAQFNVLILDEPTEFGAHHHDTKTAQYLKALARTPSIERVVLLDATPVQTELVDMHSLAEILDMNVFGPLPAFDLRYVRREKTKERRRSATTGVTRLVNTTKVVGYRHMAEYRERINPFFIRRGPGDPGVDGSMPEVTVENVYLELPPEQRRYYADARSGMITMYQAASAADPTHRSSLRARFRASFHDVMRACDTTAAFGQTPPVSVKVDWLLRRLTGDLADEKVLIFAKYKVTIRHACERMRAAGIGYKIITGDVTGEDRELAKQAFINDPSVRVMIGTTALQRGLNLQVARYLINLNQLWNPARTEQLVGRIRRMFSEHACVIVVNLIAEDTVEAKLLNLLNTRAALPDAIFEESSDLFEKLSDAQLAVLIQE